MVDYTVEPVNRQTKLFRLAEWLSSIPVIVKPSTGGIDSRNASF